MAFVLFVIILRQKGLMSYNGLYSMLTCMSHYKLIQSDFFKTVLLCIIRVTILQEFFIT